MRKIVVGSRRSNLALTQTEWVVDQLRKMGADYEFEIRKIVTKGDRIQNVTLSKVGGKALFVKEIEQAMYDGEVDIAVHSMKDMPSELPDGLVIGAIPVREDHRDAYIAKNHVALTELPSRAIVGTSSLRRASQVLALRPDIQIKSIRGNIETRLRKLEEEDYDAIILATAGMKRLGWSEDLITERLGPDSCLPSVGQGALAIECRADDDEVRNMLQKLNDAYTNKTVTAERTFLYGLEGSCQIPIAGHAHLESNEIVLDALVATSDGKTVLQESIRGTDPVAVGKEAADKLIARGAKDIVEEVKEEIDNK